MKLKMKTGNELTREKKIIIGSALFAAVLIFLGLFLGDSGILGNMVIIAIFAVIIPVFFARYTKFLWIKAAEDQFPNFIRDLADSIRSGMSFREAVRLSTRTDYGKLSEEVHRMNNRLSWGTSKEKVLDIFGKRVKKSKLITEAMNIIRESLNAGGNVAATLDAIARDMLLFKEVEAERESMVKQHVMIMYGIFFMFLGIAIMIIFVMVPMISGQGSAGGLATGAMGLDFSNPCAGSGMFPCNYFNALGVLFELPEGITLYYTSLFFTIVMIQGLFSGLIAGQLGEGSLTSGTKHSLIMVTVALGVFLFMAKAGMFPV